MRKYLTVKEFVSLAETSSDIVIYTEKNGKFRCKCNTPVTDLEWDKNTGTLSWSDSDGDPHFMLMKENDLMERITDDGVYHTSCFINVKKAG